MTTKCVIYRRYSSDEQGKGAGQTLVTQLETCTEYARKKGWLVSEVLTDDGYSAFKGEHLKPGAQLHKFVQRLAAGEIEHGTILLAYNPSRLSRLEPDRIMAWVYTTLTSQGFGLAFANKDKVFKANPTIEEHIGMVLAFQQTYGESADKSQNVRKAKQKLWELAEKREGKWVNLAARWPSWLERNESRNGWIVDEERAALVREIYQWSADGMGAVLITNRLNEIPGCKPWGKWHRYADGKWGRTAIRQLLNNPAVEGDFVPEKGMFEGKMIRGFYPRIVDADVVAKARGQQGARKRRPGKWSGAGKLPKVRHARKVASKRSGGFNSLFAGMTFCGVCGMRAFLTSSISKGRYYPYLRCEGAGDGRCKNTGYYPYKAFERGALDLCLDLALDDRFFEASGELRAAQIKEAELEREIGIKRARRQELMREFGRDPDAKLIVDELRVDVEALTAELETVKAAVSAASGKVGAVEHLRRVTDIREAAMSDEPHVREQARSKLRLAFGAILNSVEISEWEGAKVYTLAFLHGALGVRYDTKGNMIGVVADAMGKPLWEYLSTEQRAFVDPLIKRIESQQILPFLHAQKPKAIG